MLHRVALVYGLALVGVVGPIRAHAESVAASLAPALSWRAPAACPSGDLMERVAGLIGLQPEQLAAKRLRVVAVVGPSASGGWLAKLHIETDSGSGERSFEAENCDSLIKGAALVIALTVDPTATSAHIEPAAPTAAEEAPRPSPIKSTRPLFLLRPLLAADLGILPDLALAYGGALGVAWPSWRFEVDGLYQSPQTVSDGGHSGRVRAPLSTGARACASPWRLAEVLEPGACLGAGLTWLRSSGGGDLAFPETHDTLSVAVTGGLALAWRLRDWLWLRVDASLGVTVRRPKLQIQTASQSADDVYSVRWLTARFAGGVELRF
jgi:hypothetical protein